MSPSLQSISIADFRSIGGTISVPLNAPVVLIYGQNGAGKTSIMSAIELALTGELSALRRVDANYAMHLQHKDSEIARISLSVDPANSKMAAAASLTVRGGRIEGRKLLAKPDARFFSERCYLAQSSLGRLLEIYQQPAEGADAPLLRFVKELLGISDIEALIEATGPVHDLRTFRHIAPVYAEEERLRSSLESQLSEVVSQEKSARAIEIKSSESLAVLASSLDSPIHLLNAESVKKATNSSVEEQRLIELREQLRELDDIDQILSRPETSAQSGGEAAAAATVAALASEAEHWRVTAGSEIHELLASFSDIFSDTGELQRSEVDALGSLDSLISREAARIELLLSQESQRKLSMKTLEAQRNELLETLTRDSEKIASVTSGSGDFAKALTSILPFIKNSDCPVCERNFAEVSRSTLSSQLAGRIALLESQAGELVRVMGRIRASRVALDEATSALERASMAIIEAKEAKVLKARLRRCVAAKPLVKRLLQSASSAALLFAKESAARRELAHLQRASVQLAQVRSRLDSISQRVMSQPLDNSAAVNEAVKSLRKHASESIQKLQNCVEVKSMLAELYPRWMREKLEADRIKGLEGSLKKELDTVRGSLATVDKLRIEAKKLLVRAVSVRGDIVRQVFNERLNRVWQDLFIRLAPHEPFVPAFRLPEQDDRNVSTQLITRYRRGSAAGAPGAMLSAGNLNTAALTLFLALNLSIDAGIPWLLLDDPVQSMDDVHISQFAALLRTLSKQLNRQIVIAVHERQLFDYLALELSPAFEGDELITVELSKSTEGRTLALPNVLRWKQDAVAA